MTNLSEAKLSTQPNEQVNNTFTLIKHDHGIAHLVMDVIGDVVNTLKVEFTEQIIEVLNEIKADNSIKGVVLLSGKPDSFVAGADVRMIDNCKSIEEAVLLSEQAHSVFAQIEASPVPIVAAINGACLGGGLELAMACHARVCSDNIKTVLGLPEVQLGLLPGGGGTQRLPQLVGIQKSLDMMLTGKQLRAQQALKAGLVDHLVPGSILTETAENMILESQKISSKNKATLSQPRKSSLVDKLLEGNALGRRLIFNQAQKTVLSKTRGNYPAPLKIIECVKAGLTEVSAKGYRTEANYFAQLSQTEVSTQLRQLFFATTEMKKELGVAGVNPVKIKSSAVLGGGLMGGGIAFVTASKANVPVRIKDISHQGISAALRYSYNLLNQKVKRRFIRKSELQKQLSGITGTTDYSGFKQVDLVMEAVFEDLSLKQKMVEEVELNCGENTIFASNTSSLPIHKIAEKSRKPENVIGLHYFSPVDKMPLVEIIPHSGTSEQTISTTVEFAKKQGKTPIVVSDKAGFYVNRILAPYVNEAAFMLLDGEPIEKIDKALVNFGFPVGPMQLLDEVGIDIGSKISPILQHELGDRFESPSAFNKLIEEGRLGKKSKKGFYQYGKNIKGKQVDETIYEVLNIVKKSSLSDEVIIQRALFLMLNEAARCLDEGIVRNPRDGDIGAVFGIGFPPFLGGPFHYIDKLGADFIVKKLTYWSELYGERYLPCSALQKMAKNNSSYYS